MILTLTTSFPRYPNDDAGIFVQRLLEAIARTTSEEIQVLVPLDASEPANETSSAGRVRIQRFKYTLLSKPGLCFGAGILSNIAARPWLALQIPGLLIGFALHALRVAPTPRLLYVNWAACGLAAYVVHRTRGTPYVISLRGQDIHLVRARLLRPLWRLVLGNAAAMVAVSTEFQSSIKQLFPALAERVYCIPNGVEAQQVSTQAAAEARERFALPLNGKLVVTVGRLIPLKRIEVVLQALSELPDFSLTIVGRAQSSAYLANLKRQANALGLQDRVHFLGQLAPAEIPALLANAHYFVSASSSEGRPNAVLEAMVQGVPVVLSKIEAHVEVSEQGALAALFEAESPAALAQALRDCEADPAARDRRAALAKERMLAWGWHQAASKYLELFDSVAR